MTALVPAVSALIIELADELSLYGYGIQEHARCPIIQELVERARLAVGAPPLELIHRHHYAGMGRHCNICLRSPGGALHLRLDHENDDAESRPKETEA